jgi:hypothetical protein
MGFEMITHDRLKERLTYDPDTGSWAWNDTGKTAGWCRKQDGRRKIKVDGKEYYSSVLAWFYMTGEWPVLDVDHENRKRSDDTWSNLRQLTRSHNLYNSVRKRTKHNLPRGVHLHGRKRFKALCQQNNKIFHIGSYDTPEEASEAYQKFMREHQLPIPKDS